MGTVAGRGFMMLCRGVVLLVSACLALSGCHDGGKEADAVDRPSFSSPRMELKVGETMMNEVFGASVVEIAHIPSVVSVGQNGCRISVTGVMAGEGNISVRADGRLLRCEVHVTGVPSGEKPDEEDVRLNMADSSLRISVGKRVIRYDAPGALFRCEKNCGELYAASLGTGETMIFRSADALFGIQGAVATAPASHRACSSARMLSIGDNADNVVSDAAGVEFELNGMDMPVKRASIMLRNNVATWIRLLLENGETVWVVVPVDF